MLHKLRIYNHIKERMRGKIIVHSSGYNDGMEGFGYELSGSESMSNF